MVGCINGGQKASINDLQLTSGFRDRKLMLEGTEGVSSTMLRAESEIIVNIGIVGCGRIANRFAREVDYVDAANISGLYDVDSATAAAFAKQHNIATQFATYEALALYTPLYLALNASIRF